MRRSATVLVTIALAATFVSGSVFTLKAHCQQEEEEERAPMLGIVLGEGLMALAGGAGIGCGVTLGAGLLGALFVPEIFSGTSINDQARALAIAGAVGYGVGVPLGAAAGANLMGRWADENGSFSASWTGATLGAVSAAGLAAALWDGRTGQELSVLAIVLGPPIGAVIGYNLSRSGRAEIPGNSSHNFCPENGRGLSFLLPELELRRDGVSGKRHGFCGLTLARLSF